MWERTDTVNEGTVHLDPRYRWTPPIEEEGTFSFPQLFKRPFAECNVMCRRANERAEHIKVMKHPKRTPKESPQWVCVGR